MSVKLLTDHHLEYLSLKRGCTGLSESTLVKTPHCWKSHVMAHFVFGLRIMHFATHESQFHEYKAVPLFLHTTENNFGERK